MTIHLPVVPDNPYHQYHARALDDWPQAVANGTCVEPISGAVRILREKQAPLLIEPGEARELGRLAHNGDGDTLFAAAREADRQAKTLARLMEQQGYEAYAS